MKKPIFIILIFTYILNIYNVNAETNKYIPGTKIKIIIPSEINPETWEAAKPLNDYLRLPYNRKFDESANLNDILRLQRLEGVGNFAFLKNSLEIITTNKYVSGGISGYAITEDLSLIRFGVTKKRSCRLTCEFWFWNLQELEGITDKPSWKVNDSITNIYSLIYPGILGHSEMFSLNTKNGIAIHVDHRDWNKDSKRCSYLNTVINNNIITKQVELLVKELASAVELKKTKNTKKEKRYYEHLNDLLEKQSENKINLEQIKSINVNNIKFILKDKAGREVKTVYRGSKYYLCRKDGQPISKMKLWDSTKVKSKIPDTFKEKEHLDIKIYVNNYIIIDLSDNGQYLTYFGRAGKQKIKVMFQDQKGKTTEGGELEVDVQEKVSTKE